MPLTKMPKPHYYFKNRHSRIITHYRSTRQTLKAGQPKGEKTNFGLFLTIQMAENFHRSLFGHLWGILDDFDLTVKSQNV